jgi:hypothetical protein
VAVLALLAALVLERRGAGHGETRQNA